MRDNITATIISICLIIFAFIIGYHTGDSPDTTQSPAVISLTEKNGNIQIKKNDPTIQIFWNGEPFWEEDLSLNP